MEACMWGTGIDVNATNASTHLKETHKDAHADTHACERCFKPFAVLFCLSHEVHIVDDEQLFVHLENDPACYE